MGDKSKLEELKRKIRKILKNDKMNRMYTYRSYYEKMGILDFYEDVFKINKNNGFNDISITQCFHNIMNDITKHPVCPYCGKKVDFVNFVEGYRKTCGKEECMVKNGRLNIHLSYKKYRQMENGYNYKIVSFDNKKLKEQCMDLFYINNKKNIAHFFIGMLLYKGYSDLLDKIYSRTYYLDKNAKLSERVHHITNDLHNIPICKYCGKKLKWNNMKYIMSPKCRVLSSAEKNRGSKQSKDSVRRRIDTRRKNGMPWHTESSLRRISEKNKKIWSDPEVIRKRTKKRREMGVFDRQSEKMKRKIESGEFTPQITNSWFNIKNCIEINGNTYRSSWDAIYHLLNPHMEYEKIRIRYVSPIDNKYHIYIVDFLDQDNREIIEVKPLSKINDKLVKTKEKYAKDWCYKNEYTFKYINEDYFYTNLYRIKNIEVDNNRIQRAIETFEKLHERNK